jgi:hypothetical protein
VDAVGTLPRNNIHAAKDAVDMRCDAVNMRMIHRIASTPVKKPTVPSS